MTAGVKEPLEGPQRPGRGVGAAREKIVENEIRQRRGFGQGLMEITRDEMPGQPGEAARVPLAADGEGIGRAVLEIGKTPLMAQGQPQGIQIVFKADDLQAPHRAGRGEGFIHFQRRHGIGSGSQSDVPDDEGGRRFGGLAGKQFDAFGKTGLVNVEDPGFLHRRGMRMHDLSGGGVPDAGKSFLGGVHFIGPEGQGTAGGRLFGGGRGRMVQVLPPEGLAGGVVVIEETSRKDGAADFPHQLVVEPDVMLSHQLPAQGLLGFGQVMQVGAAVFGADRAGAGRIGREVLEFVDAPPELDDSPGGEESAAFGHLGRNDAVEHIDAAMHRFQHIQRGADSHQIAGTVGWK